jgi:hypothetical protein
LPAPREALIVFTTDQPDGTKTGGNWGGGMTPGRGADQHQRQLDLPSTEATFEALTGAIPEGKSAPTPTTAACSSGACPHRVRRFQLRRRSRVQQRTRSLAAAAVAPDGIYVRVHDGTDDGVEFFGGTVNVKHLVSSPGERHDGFDTDNGWCGKGQFIVVQNVTSAGASEASNGLRVGQPRHRRVPCVGAAAPRTKPTLYGA